MHRGIATFTLDTGKCPPWLFERMVKMGREIMQVLIAEFGPDEFIRRIGDPIWFQSLGTVLAFDWNASGLTTILTAALKESIRGWEKDFGIFICGGKGKTSRKTPEQIIDWSNRMCFSDRKGKNLVYNSKMSAKVDSSLIQDGFELYHHAFFFSKNGAWAVVQQGMNRKNQTARRYHWSSDSAKNLIQEPHSGIASQQKISKVLNMTSRDSTKNRGISLEMLNTNYSTVMKDIQLLRKHSSSLSRMVSVSYNSPVNTFPRTESGLNSPEPYSARSHSRRPSPHQLTLLDLSDTEFHHHPVQLENFSQSKYLEKILWKVCDQKPESYEQFLATEGVGPKTVRALALVSEIIYGAKASYTDPARYSFAHGGKDATPYPVDRKTYDQNIAILKKVVQKTHLSPLEKQKIFRRIDN